MGFSRSDLDLDEESCLLGDLVLLSSKYCQATNEKKNIVRVICESCLERSESTRQTRSCPRCLDLSNRLNMTTGTGKQVVPHKRYCSHMKSIKLVSGRGFGVVEDTARSGQVQDNPKG